MLVYDFCIAYVEYMGYKFVYGKRASFQMWLFVAGVVWIMNEDTF